MSDQSNHTEYPSMQPHETRQLLRTALETGRQALENLSDEELEEISGAGGGGPIKYTKFVIGETVLKHFATYKSTYGRIAGGAVIGTASGTTTAVGAAH